MQPLLFKLAEPVQDYNPETRQRIISILRMLEPHHIEGINKVRLGQMNDGGYVMADDFDGITTAYSLGINNDVSWDLDIAHRGIDLFQYDHTISGLPLNHQRFNWKPFGIAAQTSLDGRIKTLQEIILENGHESSGNMLLKCDIEGYEWEVFANLDVSFIRLFRQIVIEVHAFQELRRSDFAEIARQAISNLTAYHKVVHVHANNYGPWAVLGGVPLPTVLEFTLVHCDRGVMKPSYEHFPTKLDMPNNPKICDFPLGDFRM
ncbi:FkbM family methyltransferase [Methylobacterium sp. E-066]|uniref:FkbM family methyltransferase n=1 Tax=Methylobacterium sp. E-066 TaxID=2836584 RepID=UPI001FB9FB00|nr:FkbM family methyltransferase [Methylobacterium sp. E-066]MCJ2140348.1 FkbM family methyltransferase [Methylobacterium sp. E-066]